MVDSKRILTQLRVEGYKVSPNYIDSVVNLETNKVLTVGVQVVAEIPDSDAYDPNGRTLETAKKKG